MTILAFLTFTDTTVRFLGIIGMLFGLWLLNKIFTNFKLG